MDTSDTFAHIYSQNSGVYSAQIRLFIVAYGQNVLVYFCLFLVLFRLRHERFQGGKIGKVTLLVVNVAQLYYRV